MMASVQYRGKIVPKDVNRAIATIKTRPYYKFVDWGPSGTKCGIVPNLDGHIPGMEFEKLDKSAVCISNSTAMV